MCPLPLRYFDNDRHTWVSFPEGYITKKLTRKLFLSIEYSSIEINGPRSEYPTVVFGN